MNFDRLNIADCIVPPNGGVPVPDQRCSDATFAAANPGICAAAAYLIIKPGTALLCKLGSIDFGVFLYQNGVETQVTDGLTFVSSDEDILAIGVHTGSATGLAAGDVDVTVTRNGLTATAVLTVLAADCGVGGIGSCDGIHVKTSILIDDSKSMSLAFGAGYQSRLSFAQAVALNYANVILQVSGQPKDSIKVWSFTDVVNQISSDFITDTVELVSEINGVVQTQQLTDLGAILLASVNDLIAASADEKVIVLISDGEQTSTTDVQPILDTATLFKAAGGIIIAIGLRASGAGYDLLSRIATGGFFLNALPNNAADVLGQLSYLKSILCVGTCKSSAGTVNTPALDYSSFINWEVISGQVNLIGNGFLDLLPGNGLYVDMMGGTAGTIRTIDSFHLTSGQSYRVSFMAAGNNRLNTPDAMQSLLMIVSNASAVAPVLLQNIFQHAVAPAWDDPFTTFSFTFTASFDVDVKLIFQQLFDSTFTGEWHGNLLDSVKFEEVSTLTTLFEDDFDDENPVSTAANPYGGYGDDCSTAPGVQSQDPNPLPDIENGLPATTTYTSTKTFCASCQVGQTNLSDPIEPSSTENTTSYQVGTPLPQWFQNQFPTAQTVVGYAINYIGVGDCDGDRIGGGIDTFEFQGSNDGTNWTTLDTQSNVSGFGQYTRYLLTAPATYSYFRIYITKARWICTTGDVGSANVKLDLFTFDVFAAAATQFCATETATSFISQADADAKALAAATTAAQAQLNCVQLFTSTQQFTATCPTGAFGTPVTNSATATSLISQSDADAKALAAATAAAQAELDCTGSNNTQKITINDHVPGVPAGAPATPFPSVKFVSGLVGLITKVTVQIKNLSHTSPEDICMILQSPDGTAVMLMQHCGQQNAITNVDLTFDDAAASSLPDGAVITTGSYKPTALHGAAVFPVPAPQSTNATLAAFIGKTPNGSWSLWICDDADLNSGQVLNGWDLTITSA